MSDSKSDGTAAGRTPEVTLGTPCESVYSTRQNSVNPSMATRGTVGSEAPNTAPSTAAPAKPRPGKVKTGAEVWNYMAEYQDPEHGQVRMLPGGKFEKQQSEDATSGKS